MAQGIRQLRRAGGFERADRLDHWLDGLLASYTDRILPQGKFQMPPSLKAATPVLPMSQLRPWLKNAGLLLLTCNLKHFQPLGVACADPLIALPQR